MLCQLPVLFSINLAVEQAVYDDTELLGQVTFLVCLLILFCPCMYLFFGVGNLIQFLNRRVETWGLQKLVFLHNVE